MTRYKIVGSFVGSTIFDKKKKKKKKKERTRRWRARRGRGLLRADLRSKEISLDPTVAFDKLITTGHPVNEINIDRRVKSDPRDGETNQREIVLNVQRDANFVKTWRPTARGRVPLSREELGTVFDSYVRWKKDRAWVERETRSWDSRRRFPAEPISTANAIVLLEKNYCEHSQDQFSGNSGLRGRRSPIPYEFFLDRQMSLDQGTRSMTSLAARVLPSRETSMERGFTSCFFAVRTEYL